MQGWKDQDYRIINRIYDALQPESILHVMGVITSGFFPKLTEEDKKELEGDPDSNPLALDSLEHGFIDGVMQYIQNEYELTQVLFNLREKSRKKIKSDK